MVGSVRSKCRKQSQHQLEQEQDSDSLHESTPKLGRQRTIYGRLVNVVKQAWTGVKFALGAF